MKISGILSKLEQTITTLKKSYSRVCTCARVTDTKRVDTIDFQEPKRDRIKMQRQNSESFHEPNLAVCAKRVCQYAGRISSVPPVVYSIMWLVIGDVETSHFSGPK